MMSLGEEFKECPYCAEPIKKKAVYCRYCGKDLEKLPDKTDSPANTSAKPRLKPFVTPVPAQNEDINKPKTEAARRRFDWGGNLRMVLSLLIIVFLIYYWYNKWRYGRDVLVPLKMKFMRQVGEPVKTGALKLMKEIKDFSGEDIQEINEQNSSGQ